MTDMFNNKNYSVYMYVAISVVTLLLFFNSMSIVETGLKDFEFKGVTGNVVEEVKENEFDEYLDEFVDYQEVRRPKGVTGFAVEDSEDEKLEEENIPDGELYTEGSFFLYYMLLAFIGLCIFILSAVFFLPKLKELT